MIDIPDNIFPQNDQGKSICPKCKNEVTTCTCPSYEPKRATKKLIKPIVQLDKKGRKGKVVTIIKMLPPKESYLKKLAKRLKSQTGSGGTFYIEENIGTVEIQGNHVEKIKSVINNETA